MCGITGIFDTRSGAAIERAVLQRMNDSQHHRGPDEGSLHLEPGLGFGHRRLSIIDIATGQQPLFNEVRPRRENNHIACFGKDTRNSENRAEKPNLATARADLSKRVEI